MARPYQARDIEGYERDIRTLSRLRSALVIDDTLDAGELQAALHDIDSLVVRLAAFRHKLSELTG